MILFTHQVRDADDYLEAAKKSTRHQNTRDVESTSGEATNTFECPSSNHVLHNAFELTSSYQAPNMKNVILCQSNDVTDMPQASICVVRTELERLDKIWNDADSKIAKPASSNEKLESQRHFTSFWSLAQVRQVPENEMTYTHPSWI